MMELSLMAAQHFPAVSGAFMDSPYNGNTSLQTSTSNLNANFSRPSEAEEEEFTVLPQPPGVYTGSSCPLSSTKVNKDS
ncbi:uncharacterized protein LOC106023936 [Esox lucius]|uniref:uncharacterized protein LOC106023936 n=1 Tax=Esox lucius TaxID=8010 RepID=UPI000973368B|nr:uncharacterized protein LOC106023936 [Esox lucius]